MQRNYLFIYLIFANNLIKYVKQVIYYTNLVNVNYNLLMLIIHQIRTKYSHV
jgi:hypothetical protein